jgi:putative ubiquitin-RnfH superfamily antitoxin RatB of RatAB toxin-antitoxin module
MSEPSGIEVEVAYATPERQVIFRIEVPEGSTIEEAILSSNILREFPEIDLAKARVGVFGRLDKLSAPLRAGDRVEIYRPLIADPKEVRRRRAAHDKKTGTPSH